MYYTEKEIKVIKQKAYDRGFMNGVVFTLLLFIVAISTVLYFI